MSQYVERHHSTAANFEEAARVLEDDYVSPVNKSTLPSAGKTPTITVLEAEVATAVDGEKGFCAQTVSLARGYMSFLPST